MFAYLYVACNIAVLISFTAFFFAEMLQLFFLFFKYSSEIEDLVSG